ncbi:MAG: valine--tRNA ligase [Verrucomicrobia bacterium]|nr:MAG: valine--tRNA ligase [Verrucomicrobiota bacterium]
MAELPKHYDPKAIEEKWYTWWLEHNSFHSDASRGGAPYCIVIPPPNVTGILHMGHALNNTIQDVLTRWQRMCGRNAVWVPGTDHAGIATQNVVERALKKEGQGRRDLGREKFVERVWQWRQEYGGTIIRQLKKLGSSCDWQREHFTMDADLSDAVAEVFVRLYNKGLIYRGKYIINWCPRCQTALSDEESEHKDTAGKLYHLRYPVSGVPGRTHVVVATTRPETMLGDTAVAVHPNDDRYRDLRAGGKVTLPLLNRELKVIADDYVDPKFGTGVVKVTPAHDPNDFAMGQRHSLPSIDVMTDDGQMGSEAGPYAGMDRFACRKKILADLAAAGLIEKIEDHQHAVGHCYRCHTVVEPRLSPQWFVRMKPLAAPALTAVVEGRIKFTPDRWTKVYTEWMENIRDWCISRQIWWGHRIPVFYCDACGHQWAAKGQPKTCAKCDAANIRQDEDVLDTWFSSWLWPFSVFGWPQQNADLKFYYPTHTLVTASEILFFWVARMVMAGCEFMGGIPFREVYIHGTVRDDVGRKMSKSLGNSIDPVQIIEKYSADALRFSLIMLTATGQDVYVNEEKFEIGRNFGTKIWNAARFMQMQAAGSTGELWTPASAAPLSSDDQHILAKLNECIAACDDNLAKFRFNDYAKTIYEFMWHQFCDWYVEYSKQVFYSDDAARKATVLGVMHHCLSSALRLLHPLMPFLTEELWRGMGYNTASETILTAPWPKAATTALWDAAVVAHVEARHELIGLGRTLRADNGIAPGQKVDFVIKPVSAAVVPRLEADRVNVMTLLKAGNLTVDAAFAPTQAMPSTLTPLGTLYMSLGVVDVAAEHEKLTKQLAEVDRNLAGVQAKLSNENFVGRAPAAVVETQRKLLAELTEKRTKLAHLMELLQG